MAEQRSSPEEQLLRLIEKEDDVQAPKYQRRRGGGFGLGSLKIFSLSLGKKCIQGIEKIKQGIRDPNLKVANKVCLVICVMLIGYSVVDFVYGKSDLERAYRNAKRYKRGSTPEYKAAMATRPFLHYLEMVRRRNIFAPIVFQEEETPKVKKTELKDMSKDLSLVGISMDPAPVAMIEDKAEKKTYFLKKGDNIGKFTIEEITGTTVILKYEGETVELM